MSPSNSLSGLQEVPPQRRAIDAIFRFTIHKIMLLIERMNNQSSFRSLHFAGALAALSLLAASPALAWVGGPFSNNSALQAGTNGIYKTSITGKNLSGVARFVVDAAAQGSGQFTIFHEGQTQIGNTDAFLDHERKRFDGLLNGSALDGYFNAKIKSTGRSFLFNGNGQVQTSGVNGTVPTYATGVIITGGTSVTGTYLTADDPIARFTKIKVRGTRTSLATTTS